MLDAETKRKIDTARDVLVGKVPDPKSQVEQITIALIYKFMDDMDQESISMGGKPSFFIGEYEKYSWTNIFDPKLGGFEMVTLYGEALTKMSLNPNLPQLFRDIFKNAFLPFRDPETLKLFLKSINEFSYDQSERLGDAFEYLLQVMGSQGSAGQFLTPRHIINFMVQVVDPQKNETILDPACGTAGFLISAYRYILNQNSSNGTQGYANGWSSQGDKLTPDERKKMMDNFRGYDISPDMVRLSRANLYLHGFQQPKIEEYDTLTSEEHWGEMAGVILANPPFMSPKGGIRPHKKFMVTSNRSEVLFVDYIAEHLTPNGRGAVIVPEGIIFQTGTAYKQLRKYLVDQNILWAVVSLPAGVFQPYSGVKTSILFLDKNFSKTTSKIIFIRMENDGFSLGAQRQQIVKNDIPEAISFLEHWRNSVQSAQEIKFTNKPYSVNYVIEEKEKISQNGEYILTSDIYRSKDSSKQEKWQKVKIEEIADLITDGTHKTPKYQVEGIRFLSTKNLVPYSKEFSFSGYEKYISLEEHQELIRRSKPEKDDVLISKCGTIGRAQVIRVDYDFSIFVGLMLIKLKKDKILPDYFERLINHPSIRKELEVLSSGSSRMTLTINAIRKYQIPLPSMEVQINIMKEIEGYQRIIDGARQVVENWKPNIEFELEEARKEAGVEEWEMVRLGDEKYFNIEGGGTPDTKKDEFWNGAIPWATLIDLPPMDHISIINKTERNITNTGLNHSSAVIIAQDSIIVSTRATIGRVGINRIPLATNQGFKNIIIKDKSIVNAMFVALVIKNLAPQMVSLASGGTFKEISKSIFSTLEIPLPSIDIQQRIVERVENERQIVDANRKIIDIYETKIKKVIEGVWQN